MLSRFIVAVTVALLGVLVPARAEPVHGIALYGEPEAAAGFCSFLLRKSRRAEGRTARSRRIRILRQPQPAHHQRRRRQRHSRFHHRKPDGARSRRAVHAVWLGGRKRRSSRRPLVDHISSQSQGALFRRHAHHRRRRDLLSPVAEGQRATQPPHLLRQGREDRAPLGPRGALHLRRSGRPRDPAHPRPAAGAAQARHQSRHLREHDARGADRLGTLQGRQDRRRPLDHLRARSRLLGPRPAGEPRPLQLRRDPLRLLPRRLGDVRRLQVGADRPAGRRRIRGAGRTATTSRPSATAAP